MFICQLWRSTRVLVLFRRNRENIEANRRSEGKLENTRSLLKSTRNRLSDSTSSEHQSQKSSQAEEEPLDTEAESISSEWLDIEWRTGRFPLLEPRSSGWLEIQKGVSRYRVSWLDIEWSHGQKSAQNLSFIRSAFLKAQGRSFLSYLRYFLEHLSYGVNFLITLGYFISFLYFI